MKVITLITDAKQKGFKDFLEPSCEYHDLDLTVLEYQDPYITHRIKDIVLYEYLKNKPLDEIILFTDGHDTVFLSDEQEIVRKFRSFNVPLVFSAEINCWPLSEIAGHYPPSNKHFRYLNSGAFIGEAGYLVRLYESYPFFSTEPDPRYNWSNQYYWHKIYIENVGDISIDHNCELFYNTSILTEKIKGIDFRVKDDSRIEKLFAEETLRLNNEIEFLDNRILNKLTNSLPCHLHFPGPISKLLMESNYFAPIKAWEPA